MVSGFQLLATIIKPNSARYLKDCIYTFGLSLCKPIWAHLVKLFKQRLVARFDDSFHLLKGATSILNISEERTKTVTILCICNKYIFDSCFS